jgi:hypothetical protein
MVRGISTKPHRFNSAVIILVENIKTIKAVIFNIVEGIRTEYQT